MYSYLFYLQLIVYFLYYINTQYQYDSDSYSVDRLMRENPKNDQTETDEIKPTKFDFRTLIVKCGRGKCQSKDKKPALNKTSIFVREDESQYPSFLKHFKQKIKKCQKKILVEAQIYNKGLTDCNNQYIIIDHVYDPLTNKNAKLLNPYVIKFKQQPIMQSYNLMFERLVNAKPKELIKDPNSYGSCEPFQGKIQQPKDFFHQGFKCPCNRKNPEKGSSTESTKQDYNSRTNAGEKDKCITVIANDNSKPDFGTNNDQDNAIENYANRNNNNCKDKSKQGLNSKIRIDLENNTFSSADFKGKCQGQTKDADINTPDFSKDLDDLQKNLGIILPAVGILDTKQDVNNPDFGSLNDMSKNFNITCKINNNQDDFKEANLKNNLDVNLINNHTANKFNSKMDQNTKTDVNCNKVQSNNFNLEEVGRVKVTRMRRFVRRQDEKCEDTKQKNILHCFSYSDLWYNVYRMENPRLHHTIELEIYEKCRDCNDKTRWKVITSDGPIIFGTDKLHYQNIGPTIAADYLPPCRISENSSLFALNVRKFKLLIPELSNTMKAGCKLPPPVSGGPPEYLVVPKDKISKTGKNCNRVGVGAEAFYKQKNRCSKPHGSCLQNQPVDFWLHDTEAEKKGQKGTYFLKYFGMIPSNPLVYVYGYNNPILYLYYDKNYTNKINVEFKADFNTILKASSSALISEIYTDGSDVGKVSVMVKVINSGLVSGIFYISFTNCPSFNNIASRMALIPPQNQHIFNIDIEIHLPNKPVYCTVEALNNKHELLAIRKITIQKSDKCVCIWHCQCTCLVDNNGLKCDYFTLESYNAAGLQGGLPVASHFAEYTVTDDMLSILLYLFLFLCVTLLIMGLTKALIGLCCCREVGLWGFDVILNLPQKDGDDRDQYGGWPEDSKYKNKNISPATEFCLNVVFFFTYPMMMMVVICKDICCPSYTYETGNQECVCSIELKESSSSQSPFYGDSSDAKKSSSN